MRGIVVVCGSTGTGKSQLAIQLAQKFNGEVINADAMQMYRGLKVVTNKVSWQEQKGIPHHLLDHLDLDKEYMVGNFVKDCEKVVEDVLKREKLPILVGGTHYYLQSFLWTNSLQDLDGNVVHPSIKPELAQEIQSAIQQEVGLHSLLQRVDPKTAAVRHRNETRKIIRALQVYLTTGEPVSLEKPQKLRYPTCALWVYSQPDLLDKRLDKRVDEMVARSEMWQELEHVRTEALQGKVFGSGSEGIDWTRGIFQTIGFKEFSEYYDKRDSNLDLSKLKMDAMEQMKRATRRYAKSQVTWVKNKLAPKLLKDGDPRGGVWILDSSEPLEWNTRVLEPACEIVHLFMTEDYTKIPPSCHAELLEPSKNSMANLSWEDKRLMTCDICKDFQTGLPKEFMGKALWEQHLTSRGHKGALERLKKLETNVYFREAVLRKNNETN